MQADKNAELFFPRCEIKHHIKEVFVFPVKYNLNGQKGESVFLLSGDRKSFFSHLRDWRGEIKYSFGLHLIVKKYIYTYIAFFLLFMRIC